MLHAAGAFVLAAATATAWAADSAPSTQPAEPDQYTFGFGERDLRVPPPLGYERARSYFALSTQLVGISTGRQFIQLYLPAETVRKAQTKGWAWRSAQTRFDRFFWVQSAYVPHKLDAINFALLKKSMRAEMEKIRASVASERTEQDGMVRIIEGPNHPIGGAIEGPNHTMFLFGYPFRQIVDEVEEASQFVEARAVVRVDDVPVFLNGLATRTSTDDETWLREAMRGWIDIVISGNAATPAPPPATSAPSPATSTPP